MVYCVFKIKSTHIQRDVKSLSRCMSIFSGGSNLQRRTRRTNNSDASGKTVLNYNAIMNQPKMNHAVVHHPIQKMSLHLKVKTSTFSTLADVLQREITQEAENPLNEMPADLAELKNSLSEHWTIVEGSKASSTDGATIKMYKKENLSNGSKVTLTFHCQDSLNPEELGFLESAAHAASDVVSGDEEEEEGEEDSTPIKFDLVISRGGKFMHVNCTSEAAEVTIDSVMIAYSEDVEENLDLYRGPMLEDLPEDLRDSLDQYVQEECGVGEDVAAFIAMYADYMEQMEYIKWLKNVKNIIE